MEVQPPLPPRPGSSTGSRTGLEITAKFTFLQWLLYFFNPTIVIDGSPHVVKWGTHFFELAPGRHQVEVFFRYLFFSRADNSSIDMDLAEGQVRRLRYRPPWLVFLKGRLREL